MHSRRALLYMPGDDRRKIEKATTLGVDCVCMDMEDGVAITQKSEARAVIAEAMKELDFGGSERCIRINSVGSGLEKYDLAAAVATNPEAVVVPKVETAQQVRAISEYIEVYERSSRMPLGRIRMLVGVETAKGILNLKEIAESDRRLEAIIFAASEVNWGSLCAWLAGSDPRAIWNRSGRICCRISRMKGYPCICAETFIDFPRSVTIFRPCPRAVCLHSRISFQRISVCIIPNRREACSPALLISITAETNPSGIIRNAPMTTRTRTSRTILKPASPAHARNK